MRALRLLARKPGGKIRPAHSNNISTADCEERRGELLAQPPETRTTETRTNLLKYYFRRKSGASEPHSLLETLPIRSIRKQRLNISAAVENVENPHVVTFDTVDDDVPGHGETTQTGSQVLSAPPDVRITRKQVESLRQ